MFVFDTVEMGSDHQTRNAMMETFKTMTGVAQPVKLNICTLVLEDRQLRVTHVSSNHSSI